VSPPPIPAPRASGYTTSTTHPLYWARWGPPDAPKLLVLHGGPAANHDYLLPQMLELTDQYELVFYDQRGGGKSKTDGRDVITWRTQVDDLALVASELVPGPLSLIGYSWGALLSLLYAIERRSPVPRRLVLIAPAAISFTHRQAFDLTFAHRQNSEWLHAQRAALAASGLRESDPDAYRQRGFELSVSGYFADPEKARDLTPFRVTSRVQQSIWDSLGDYDFTEALRDLEIPSLAIHGREDPIPLEATQQLSEALGSRLIVLDGSGHVPYVERPAPLFSAIRTFLSETAPKATE
jgi:proline iminopeptidase